MRATCTTCSTTLSSHSRSSRVRVVRQAIEQGRVLAGDVLHVPQPVVDQAERLALVRRVHAAAAVVPDDEHVLDLEHVDRELQYRQAIEIGMHDDIRDVAMDEDPPGGRSTISFAGTRLSEQPIHK